MIDNYESIEKLFKEISKKIKNKINVYVIGGAVLLRQGLKDVTKDIDLVVDSRTEFVEFQEALLTLGFKPKIPGKEYTHMNLSQIFQKDDFRIDLFHKEVCGKFSLTEDMKKRSHIVFDMKNLCISHCSNEDILLFKTMTEREGDLDDCMSLATTGINWDTILKELMNQIEHSKEDVWLTWVAQRLDILEERGLNILIMKDIDGLRDAYFEKLERKHGKDLDKK